MRTLILCLCVLFFGSVRADEGCGRHVKKYQDLLSCVEEKSPEIEGVRLETERARSQVGEAGQWKNPELSADSFHGKSGGFERSSTEISLGVPLELGGKRSARAAAAQSGLSAAEVKLSLVRSKVRAEAVLKLHRLRQVLHERDLMDEAIGTFERLVNQYRKRPGLSPEQRTSLSVYQLVKGEYELQKVAAGDEILAIETFFRLQAGLDSEKLKSFLPASPKVWPTMGRESSNAASPVQRLLRAEVDLASAELAAARGDSWPTIVVGPSVQIVKEAGQTNTIMGFNLSLPLPLFNLNGAGRAAAAAGLKAVEARARFGAREQELKREELLKVYDQSVKSLSGGISHEEIEKRHHESEKLFLRGVVPSALVIDAHRTSLDLERTRHERELRALRALLDLAVMEDRLGEVSL